MTNNPDLSDPSEIPAHFPGMQSVQFQLGGSQRLGYVLQRVHVTVQVCFLRLHLGVVNSGSYSRSVFNVV